MDELKPCPFCGGDMNMVYRSASRMYMIYHEDGGRLCDIIGPFKIHVSRARSLGEAADCWNRRANND